MIARSLAAYLSLSLALLPPLHAAQPTRTNDAAAGETRVAIPPGALRLSQFFAAESPDFRSFPALLNDLPDHPSIEQVVRAEAVRLQAAYSAGTASDADGKKLLLLNHPRLSPHLSKEQSAWTLKTGQERLDRLIRDQAPGILSEARAIAQNLGKPAEESALESVSASAETPEAPAQGLRTADAKEPESPKAKVPKPLVFTEAAIKQSIRIQLGAQVLSLALAGAAYWRYPQFVAQLPPILVGAAAVAYAAHRLSRIIFPKKETAAAPAPAIIASLSGIGGYGGGIEVLRDEPLGVEERSALLSVEVALMRLADAGLPLPVDQVLLVEHPAENFSSYYAEYDPGRRVLTLSAQTITKRFKAVAEALPLKDIHLDDAAIPVVFREVALAGFPDGRKIPLHRLLEADFTIAFNDLAGAEAIQAAKELLAPETPSMRRLRMAKRFFPLVLAAGAMPLLLPLLVQAFLSLGPAAPLATLLWAGFKISLYGAVVANLLIYGSMVAARGTGQMEGVRPDVKTKIEQIGYNAIIELGFPGMAAFLAVGGLWEEVVFRAVLFTGLLYWFSLLPMTSPAAAVLAGALSSWIFAKIHASTHLEMLLGRFLIGAGLVAVFALTGNLWLTALIHMFFNLFSLEFANTRSAINKQLSLLSKRK